MINATIKLRAARLGEQLVNNQVLTEEQLEQALKYQQETGLFLGEALLALDLVSPTVLGQYLEQVTGFPFVDLADSSIDTELARSIPESVCRRKLAMPFGERDNKVLIAMVDPLDLATVDDMRARLDRPITPCLVLEPDLQEAINRIYDVRHKAQSVLEEIDEESSAGDRDLSVDELVGMAEDAPIVRLVNSIISAAISGGASDIHIEPNEKNVRVRCRQDGLLYDQMTFPRRHLAAVVSRIKIMSHLNIAERRRPQDGRFVARDDNEREFDMRVSIMPLIFGEKICMRVLEKSSSYGDPHKLGLFPDQQEIFEHFIRRPHGIILVTGPTGSGKSTTLYAALTRINDSTLNINTVEDPVEYHLPGLNQMQVNPKIGVTFATGLRTLVRQDPDVIMVGEIRDLETAEVAIQAALTGHLVLSTLHTNDAPGAMIRLQNMGVEPFLISSAVIGVIGQRLLRTVCPHCKSTSPASPAVIDAFGLPATEQESPVLASGAGCSKCGGRGMKGRTAVYEIMPMSDKLRDMVLRRESGSQLRGQAIAEGMMTMREAGIRKALQGMTTLEEVTRVLFSEDF
ncbi:MAG TPA: GspE/PulE family protein [Chthonomonadaceae bacterium]|nr:GspE/PulE family protein [Chthonomonadaceae bacterium]